MTKKRKKKKSRIYIIWLMNLCLTIAVIAFFVWHESVPDVSPENALKTYMAHILNREYEQMYEMIDAGTSGNISKEDFVKRNSAIYEGIGVDNMKVHITSYDKEQKEICYETSMDTVAGNVTFENKASFILEKGKYKLIWNDSLIFPELDSTDKVKVSTTSAKRGQIIDRNGHMLAGEGVASSIGVVPGKLENKNDAISQLAELLEMKTEDIEKKLAAKWVKDDSFVPLKTAPKVNELKLMSIEPDQETLAEKDRQEKLLEIPGVKISDITVREYPLGEAAAHLVGYVQNVTAEDLEEHAGEGYTSNSVIGKSGMEGLFEKELKGQNGCAISIVDSNGNKKKIVVSTIVENGKDIKLTIDSDLQKELYEQFKDDKSCSVAMNQYTGEVLALSSTPSYDNNDFIMGMSNEKWTVLNEDERKPMYNRFRQVWCPGSTFKPIIAAIGLTTGAIDPDEDYGNEGLSWQKDSSWGSYYVTTLHAYEPVILKNALIYSDNIYFAKAALKIGERDMESSLTKLGFNEELPFDIKVAKSQFSNTDKIEKEIQLADSGYGQGQILVNPLHMACIYSAFCNEGNMIKPYLTYKEDAIPNVWITAAFTKDAAQMVLEDTKEVINNPHGTGYAACRTDITLAGKTGTAEIKASKEDTTGTELGWFSVFTTDENMDRPIMIISMVEDIKWFIKKFGIIFVIKEWKYTDKGWFCYELCVPEPPEVTEIVDGSCLVRIKPLSKEQREMSERCVQGLGYQGNNLLCSNWDTDHMEKLDYNGMYEYLYAMKHQKAFDAEDYPNGIPKEEFESLIMEYLPVTAEQIQEYAVFDEKNQTYVWVRLGCLNYAPTFFGTSLPEVIDIKENEDGTVTLTVDAVCDMVICDDAVITHELTVKFADDGSFQYLGNEILNDGIKEIPDYQYRINVN